MFKLNQMPYDLQVGDVLVETNWNRVTSSRYATIYTLFRQELTTVTHDAMSITVSKEVARAVRKDGVLQAIGELLRPRGLTVRAPSSSSWRVPYGRRGWIVKQSTVTWVVKPR